MLDKMKEEAEEEHMRFQQERQQMDATGRKADACDRKAVALKTEDRTGAETGSRRSRCAGWPEPRQGLRQVKAALGRTQECRNRSACAPPRLGGV